MFTDAIFALLQPIAGEPLFLALAIIAATLLLEDAATVAVGLLASQMVLDPGPAVAALFVGTVVGDFGLYGVGRASARTGWAQGVRGQARMRRAEAWLASRADVAVAGARFVPGLRLPIYTASGFLGLPFARFAAIVVGVSALWTPALFWLSSGAGAAGAARLGDAGLLLALLAVAAAVFAPRLTRRLAAA